MKLHLPLRLLFALLAALAVNSSWGAEVTISGSSVTLNPQEYSDGLQVTASNGGRVIMDSASTTVVGSIGISLSGSSSFTMERGTLGNGASSPVTLDMLTGSSFQMGGSGVLPVLATGRGNVTSINLSDSTFTMLSGTVATSGAELTLNIGSGALFDLRNGTVSNGSYLSQNTEGGVSFVHTTAVINVNNGGQFVMGSAGNIGYAGGGAVVHVNSGGVFTQNGGLMGFARGAEGGRVEMQVHDGGVYRMKGGNIAASNARSRVTVESGGVFELGGTVTKNDSGDVISRTSGKISAGSGTSGSYTDIVVKSGGVFNMSDGSIASVPTAGDGEVYIQLNGTFNQSGGDVATGNGKALIRVQNGGSYVQSGGSIGLSNGTAALEVQRGGSYTLKGGGSISGHVEVALGYATELTVSYKGSSNLWPDEVTPEAPAESGSYTFVQEGGVVDGEVSIGIVGADASYTQSGGEIGGNVSISVSGGASFELSGEGEIIGQASVTIGSGSSFVMSGGAIAEGASLIFNGASFVQSSGSIGGGAGDHVSITLIGGTHTQSGGSMALAEGDTLTLSEGAVFAQSSGGSISGGSLSLSGEGTRFSSDGGSIVGTDITLAEGTGMSLSGSALSGSISAEAAEVEQSGGQVLADVSITDGAHYTQKDNAAVQGDISIENAEWVMEGGSIVHGSAIGVAEGGSFTQKGGSIDASIAVTSGSFEQNGFVSGDITVQGAGSTYTQKAGNITDGSSVSVADGAHFTQESGDIDADIQVSTGSQLGLAGTVAGKVAADASSVELQASGSITGDVELSHGAELTLAGSITGKVAADASTIDLQKDGGITGDVELSHGAELTQASDINGSVVADASVVLQKSGAITGNVELRQNASLTQSGSIGGKVTLGTNATLTQEGGLISGGVSMSGGSTLAQKEGSSIFGGLTAAGSTISQVSAGITGDVILNENSTLTQESSSITGNVILSSGSTLTQQSSSITGNVFLSSGSTLTQQSSSITGKVQLNNATFTQDGDIGGDIEITNKSVFKHVSGLISSAITVVDSQVEMGDVGIGGGVSVTNGSYTQGNGAIGGGVTVNNAVFTHGVGNIGGSVVATTQSSLKHAGGDILGDVQLEDSKLEGSAGEISGNVELTASTATLETAQIDGNVSASDESEFTLKDGTIAGDVKVDSSAISLGSVDVAGGISVEGDRLFEHQSGVVSGAVLTSGATFRSGATIQNDVEVKGGEFSQLQGGSITGNVRVTSASFNQVGNIGGEVSVTNGSYSMGAEGSIAGRVSVAGSTFEQKGNIENDLTLSEASVLTMAGGKTSGTVSVEGGSTLTMNAGSIEGDTDITGSTLVQAGGSIGEVSLTLTDSTFTRKGGSISASVSMSGAKSLYDMGNSATGGSILLNGGNLANASNFAGTLTVDTDATYNNAINLGGVAASAISSIATRSTSAVLTNVGEGVLTIAAGTRNTMLVGTETSSSTTNGKNYLINFKNSGSIAFEDEGVITLNFSANVLKEAKEHNDHTIEVWFTNGTLSYGSNGLTEWLSRHFAVGSGLLGDNEDNKYGWTKAEGGKITLHVNTDGIWISSLDENVTSEAEWNLFKNHRILIVDEDMSIVQQESGSLQLNQLNSGGDHNGNLTIELTHDNTEVKLNNHESVANSGNGDTVFNGSIILTGDKALSSTVSKVGEGTLTAGSIIGAGALSVEEGSLVLTGENSSAGSLKMASGVTLELRGSLTLSGSSTLSDGKLIGGGTLTQNGGELTLEQGVTVQVDLVLGRDAQVQREGDVVGSITLSGDSSVFTHKGAGYIAGDIALSGVNSQFKHTEQGGDIGGGVSLSGDGSVFIHGGGNIGGGVELSGSTSRYENGNGDIAGSVSLAGEYSSFEHGEGDIAGDVMLSGAGSKFSHGSGSIIGSVALKGAESVFEMEFTTIGGSVSMAGKGSRFTQTGDIIGGVEVSGDGAIYTGRSGSIGADVTISGAESEFTQGGEIAGQVQLLGNKAKFTGNGSGIGGSVLLQGDASTMDGGDLVIEGSATLSGKGAQLSHSTVKGDVLLSGEGAQLSQSAVKGNVLLSGTGTRIVQSGALTGSVTLAGSGSSLEGDVSGVGGLTLSGTGAQASHVGDISGDALLSADKTSVTDAGRVSGSVMLEGTGSVFSGTDVVEGSATLSGKGSSFSSQGVKGDVILVGKQTQAEVLGDVGGRVNLEGAGALFSHTGKVQGDVSISGAGSTYRQKGGVDGSIIVSGDKVTFTSDNTIAGDLTITGQDFDGTLSETSKVSGNVSITAARATLIAKGIISGETLLSGEAAVLDLDNSSGVGLITLQAGTLAHAGGYDGPGVVINTTDAQQGTLNLGGLKADKVLSISTGSGVNLAGLAQGTTLSFTGINTMYADKANAIYGDNAASAAMIQFDGSGAVSFANGGQLKLRFGSELVRDFGSGKLEIWLTNGAIMGMPEDEEALLAWLQEHILLATGSGMEYALKNGEFSGAHEGWLTISASSSDIWKTSEWDSTVKNPGAFNSFSKVDIDSDTTLLVHDNQPSHAILRQLEGDHDLDIINTGSGELTVELNNKNVLGYYGETTFNGDITAKGKVVMEKTGDADLTLAGNLKTPGRVDVKEGKLILNGAENEIDSITLGEKPADGSFSTGALEVNGAVKLTGESDLSASLGNISGVGALVIAGKLILGEGVSLNGPSVQLEDGGTLNLNGTQAAIAGLNGTGALHLGDGGALTVSGSGTFSGTLAGSGVLSTSGKGSSLSLVGSGNVNYDLVVGANTSLSLSREVQPVAVRAASAGQEITYHSVTNAGTLQVLGAEGHTSLVALGDITLGAGSVTEVAVDIAAPASAALASTGGKVIIENGAMISLGLVGKPTGGELKVTLISGAEGVYDESGALWSAGADMPNVSFNEAIFDLLYDHVNVEVGEDSKTVTLTATEKVENDLMVVADTRNSQAGADLLFEALKVADPEENPTLRAAGNAVVEMLQAGDGAAAARVQAAMAGSTVTALGAAQRDALREQLLRTRDRSATLMYGESTRKVVYIPKVYTSIEAMGGYSKLSADGDESGYKLNTWGGSVSAEKHIKHSLHVGLALSALYGDLDAEAADTATGSLDSYYVNLYMRGTAGKWSHSVVVTLGMNSAELDRTVNYGAGSYTTHGSTDGVGVGALYEVAYDIALNAERSSILQPLLNFAVVSTSMKGYEEQGADGAGLRVDDQSWTTASVSLGARWAGRISPAFFGRGAWAELRLNVAQDLGDTAGSADVAMLANPALSRTVYGAEVGSTAIQLGAGVSVPVSAGAGGAVIYLNGTSDFRSGASSWNVSAGLRMGF